jgi:hypothetical protein
MKPIVTDLMCLQPAFWLAAGVAVGLFLGSSQVEASDIDRAVLSLLDSKCSECHKPDEEEPDLSKGIDLGALRRSKFVEPGNPLESKLFELVNLPESDKKRMPWSRGKAGDPKFKEPLSSDEKELIRSWILGETSLPATASHRDRGEKASKPQANTRAFISENEIHALVLADLKTGGVQDQRSWRYVTLHNYWNQADVPETDIDHFGQGVSKLANSLSSLPKIKRPKSLDERGIVFRIDARDYNFDFSLWTDLMRHYPFGVDRGTQEEAEIERLAGEWPVIRADWWTFMLAQPPFYYQVLRFPGSNAGALARNTDKDRLGRDGELERRLGVATNDLLKSDSLYRMGFEKSGVSQGNRVVERHPVGKNGGYYWKSFDFNADRKQVNTLLNPADVFRAPLGPPEYGLTTNPRNRFRADGGEILFSLPNGLQAYMLTDGQGKRLDKGPFEVVQDDVHPRGTILAGISCMSCHARGLRSSETNKEDEVSALADDIALTELERETVKRLYGRKNEMKKLIEEDMARFEKALLECGVTSEKDPIGRLYFRFLKNPIPIASLGAEMGTEMEDIAAKLRNSGTVELRSNASRSEIDRLVFLSLFSSAAKELGLGTPRPFTPIAVAETEGAFRDAGVGQGLLANPLKGGSWKPPTAADGATKGAPAPPALKMRRVVDEE